MAVRLIESDSLTALKALPDSSVDSIVTDPPYGLSFMGKRWDYDVPDSEHWRECLRVLKTGGHLIAFGGTRTYHRLACGIEDAGFEIRDMVNWLFGSGMPKSKNLLKPGHEPICLARKAGKGVTLNIDSCRIGEEIRFNAPKATTRNCYNRYDNENYKGAVVSGRWPSNVIVDQAVADQLEDRSSFFYCAKASPTERDGNTHPTVKPLSLMRYLVRLVTPTGGTVLDPFSGSGTTAVACELEGFDCIAIEREPEYVAISQGRLKEIA